jgi:hypothetical protein
MPISPPVRREGLTPDSYHAHSGTVRGLAVRLNPQILMTKISTQQNKASVAAVLEILEGTPIALAELAGLCMPEQWRQPLAEGERSFTEVIAHLLNGEGRTADAMYMALLVDTPFLRDIHPDRHLGKLLNWQRFDVAELLPYFNLRRKVLLNVLHSLSDDQWGRAIEEEGKQRKESVYRLARALAMHEQEHVMHLARFLRRTPAL